MHKHLFFRMLTDFPRQALVFMCLQYKSFENTAGKREISSFLTVFSTCMESLLPFSINLYCHLQTLSVWKSIKFVIWKLRNIKFPLSGFYCHYNKIFDMYNHYWQHLKADIKSNMAQVIAMLSERVEYFREKHEILAIFSQCFHYLKRKFPYLGHIFCRCNQFF